MSFKLLLSIAWFALAATSESQASIMIFSALGTFYFAGWIGGE